MSSGQWSVASGQTYKPPFPWFGGKSRAASLIWERFGNVPNYVEPFFGSGAVLFLRPHAPKLETVNDKDGHLANFWRAVQADPDGVARYADWPINENDLHARHLWLVTTGAERVERLTTDPDYYDVKIAGWWVWGICQWIGSGWCRRALAVDDADAGNAGMGVHRQRPHLGNAGMGVHRQLPHLGNAGMGVHRQLPHLGNAGRGVDLVDYLRSLSDRLRRVRVCCGDWTRVLGPTPTEKNGITGVLLDPPYDTRAGRVGGLYAVDTDVSAAVREWAIVHGDNPKLRIALCGYDGEHAMPDGWACVAWKAHGGYGSQGNGRGRANAGRERIWFSPHCLASASDNEQAGLAV